MAEKVPGTPPRDGGSAAPGPEAPGPDAATSGGPPTISTHVLDTGQGSPATGVHVTLYRLGESDRPIRLTQALTDDDGRVRDLLGRRLSPGVYRLEFNLAGRDAGASVEGPFFERLAVDLKVSDPTRSYHVPLLLAPFSMTTYRGS